METRASECPCPLGMVSHRRCPTGRQLATRTRHLPLFPSFLCGQSSVLVRNLIGSSRHPILGHHHPRTGLRPSLLHPHLRTPDRHFPPPRAHPRVPKFLIFGEPNYCGGSIDEDSGCKDDVRVCSCG